MAERLAVAHCRRRQIDGLEHASAGTRAVIGHPIHRHATAVLEALGGDASAFAARQLNPKVAVGADLVLAMTKAHRDRVLEVVPRLLRVTFTLSEAHALITELQATDVADMAALRPQLPGDRLVDIDDPIGQEPEVFAAVAAHIADLLPPVLELCGRGARG